MVDNPNSDDKYTDSGQQAAPAINQETESNKNSASPKNEQTNPFKWMRNGSSRVKRWLFLPTANHIIAIAAIVTAAATITYTVYAGRQWRALTASSAQTDRLICETHALATNTGMQATNTANEVTKLGALVAATNRQATATGGELAVMQSQLEALDRPWVNLTIALNEGLHFDQEGKTVVKLTWTIQNSGKATAVEVSPHIFIRKHLRAEMFQADLVERDTFCTKWQSEPHLHAGEFVLFPGQQLTSPSVWSGIAGPPSGPAPQGWPTGFWNDEKKEFRVLITGCVDYHYASSTRNHQTGIAYELRCMKGPNNYCGLTSGTDVSIENLALEPYWLGGFYAN
jgi:hypothetical protein